MEVLNIFRDNPILLNYEIYLFRIFVVPIHIIQHNPDVRQEASKIRLVRNRLRRSAHFYFGGYKSVAEMACVNTHTHWV